MTIALRHLLLAALLAPATARADTPIDALPEPLREVFARAEAAWDAGDLEGADALYGEVLAGAPEFDRAWRRQCGVRIAREKVSEGRKLCRKAVALVPSVENRTGLAIALTQRAATDDNVPMSTVEAQPGMRPQLEEARRLLEGVLDEAPDYIPAWQALCAWSVEALDDDALDRCIETLQATDPDNPAALYHVAIRHMSDGELEEAARALRRAKQNGLPDDKFKYLALRLGAAGAPPNAEAARASRTLVQTQKVEGSWADAIPWVIAGLLVLGVGVLVFFGGDEEQDPPPGP